MLRRLISPVAVLTAALLFGCGTREQPSSITAESQKESNPTPIPSPARSSKIPVEVSYPMTRDEDYVSPTISKRMVDVRLNMKISPEILREIALDVKSKETRQYERTFIFYYMPADGPNEPRYPWATTHFNPTLEVQIHGLTREAEASLKNIRIDHAGKKIGVWLVQKYKKVDLIFEDSRGIKLAEVYPDGARFDSEMIELPSQIGRRFKKTQGTDVYEVDNSGVLRLYDGRENMLFSASFPME